MAVRNVSGGCGLVEVKQLTAPPPGCLLGAGTPWVQFGGGTVTGLTRQQFPPQTGERA